MRTSFFIASTTTLLFFHRPVKASNTSCDTLSNANATVSNSNTVPALHPQDPINGSLYGEYTISTAVREVIDDTNASSVLQDFWLRSSKPVSTPPLQLPFAGCAFFLLASQDSDLIGADLDNVGCSKALPDGCEDALIDALRTNVTILSEEQLSDNTSTCSSLTQVLQTPPTECKGAVWDEVVAIRKLDPYHRESQSDSLQSPLATLTSRLLDPRATGVLSTYSMAQRVVTCSTISATRPRLVETTHTTRWH